jgi:hypothetical protein
VNINGPKEIADFIAKKNVPEAKKEVSVNAMPIIACGRACRLESQLMASWKSSSSSIRD